MLCRDDVVKYIRGRGGLARVRGEGRLQVMVFVVMGGKGSRGERVPFMFASVVVLAVSH
jgi:hypothetical protein